MNSVLFYSIVAFAIIGVGLAVTDPFDLKPVYADDANPYVLQDSKNDYYYEYGQLKKSVHKTYNRLLDYYDYRGNPVYIDYKITEYPTYISYESAQYSAVLDKGTCEFRQYDGGKLSGGETPRMKLNHSQKSALNGTDNWNDETVNNENCTVEIQNKKLIATKNNVVDLENNQTDGTEFKTIYDLNQDGFEWTYENTNLDSDYTDQKFGNTFVCEGADCGSIAIDGEAVSVGETKTKNEIIGKNIKVGNTNLDLKENQHGYTWALKRTGSDTMIIDFTDSKGSLGYGEKLVIDPVMDFTSADTTRRSVATASDTTNGKDCSDADDPNVTGFSKTTFNTVGTQNQCVVMVLVFDLSDPSLAGATVTQARVRYDIDLVSASTVSGAWSAVDRDYDTDTAEQMYRDIVGDTDGGADGDNSPTIYVDDISNMKTVATDYIDVLGSDANTDITNAIGGDFYLGSVWGSSESVYTGANEYFNWSTNADVELEITYTLPSAPEKPTGLSTEALPFALNGTWTGCESDGKTENSCSLISGVSVWNTTDIHYADIPLPDNAGSDTEFGSVTNSVDFTQNDILYHFEEANDNNEIQDFGPNNNNATLSDLSAPTFETGLVGNATNSFPLNFTSTDSLTENNSDFALGGFVNQTDSNDFNLLAYNTSSSGNPVEIGINGSYLYVRDDSNDLATWSNTCNTLSWCHVMIERASNVFEAFLNGTTLGTASDSTSLGTAQDNYFIIGGNNTLVATSTSALDEYFINSGSESSQVSAISERGLNDPVWIENLGNQTFAYIDGLNTNEESFYRVQLMNSIDNGTYSDLIYGTTDNIPDAPSITASAASATQIDIVRTAGASDGGDAVTNYDLRASINDAAWTTLVSGSAIANFYNHTGLSSGDTVVYQWRDTNGVGNSAWSANATATTYEPTSGTVSFTGVNVGDVIQFDAVTVTISNGSPEPITVDQIQILQDNTVVKTSSISESFNRGDTDTIDDAWFQITDDSSHEYALQIRASNTTGTVSIVTTANTTLAREYDPNYFTAQVATEGLVNYTINRDSTNDIINLKVNRDQSGNTFQVECLYQSANQAIFSNNTGTWSNYTGVGFINDTQSGWQNSHAYIACYNDELLFTVTSYTNSSLSLLGIQAFDDIYGEFIGVPVAVFFLVLVAGYANPRTAPIWLVVVLGMAGVLATTGFLTLSTEIWALALIAGIFGLFVGRKFF